MQQVSSVLRGHDCDFGPEVVGLGARSACANKVHMFGLTRLQGMNAGVSFGSSTKLFPPSYVHGTIDRLRRAQIVEATLRTFFRPVQTPTSSKK